MRKSYYASQSIYSESGPYREALLRGGAEPQSMARWIGSIMQHPRAPESRERGFTPEQAADLELRYNILLAKLALLPGISMADNVVDFLARRLTNSIRELEGALNRIGAYALMTGRAIDLAFVEEVLANVLRANQRRISIDEIQTRVADHYCIRKAEMVSARRAREVARPRQVAMYLSKQLTPKSLPDIGRRFGGRDHTTVIHAVKQIEKLRASDPDIDAAIRLLTRQLEG